MLEVLTLLFCVVAILVCEKTRRKRVEMEAKLDELEQLLERLQRK